MHQDPRRRTPRTDVVLDDPRLTEGIRRLGRRRVKDVAAVALQSCRDGDLAPEDVVDLVLSALPRAATSLHPVVNATGILVHTNLGRAPLSPAAVDAVVLASGTTDVEFDLVTGHRGRRGAGALAALVGAVPDAGGVHLVNNGAAALALVTAGLARGREVVVARGEMVEIGDGFRLPELLESAGARLREVGTTNRVRLDDYAAVVNENTAFVLKVHPSNFRVEGFTSSVPVQELATLAVPVVVDIGSGLLVPHPRLPEEPDAASCLRMGADLVTASGDKLLGGPQCGLLLGRADLVEQLRRHPMARALRVDKLTLAALEATLTGPTPPVVSALSTGPEKLLSRASAVAAALDGEDVQAVWSLAAVGGGGAPGVELGSAALSLPDHLAEPLRRGSPAVVGHLSEGRLLLDLIAVPPDQDAVLVQAVRRAFAAASSPPPRTPGT